MSDDLFTAIESHLGRHGDQMVGRRRFQSAMDRAHGELELWDCLRPYLRTADDYRAASAFLAAWTRQRARD